MPVSLSAAVKPKPADALPLPMMSDSEEESESFAHSLSEAASDPEDDPILGTSLPKFRWQSHTLGAGTGDGKASDPLSEELEDADEFSDVSNDSVVFHIAASHAPEPRTDEEMDLCLAESIVEHLRDFPLLPVDAGDAGGETFLDLQSGMRLPQLHCAIKNCTFTLDAHPRGHWSMEKVLTKHLLQKHRHAELSMLPDDAWPVYADDDSMQYSRDYDFKGACVRVCRIVSLCRTRCAAGEPPLICTRQISNFWKSEESSRS